MFLLTKNKKILNFHFNQKKKIERKLLLCSQINYVGQTHKGIYS